MTDDHEDDDEHEDEWVSDASGEMRSATSTALFLAREPAQMRGQRCERCGITFVLPDRLLTIHGYEADRWSLDVGGYCPQCKLYLCHLDSHFELIVRGAADVGGGTPVCNECGARLVTAPGASNNEDMVVVFI
jgi:hypothetical protein